MDEDRNFGEEGGSEQSSEARREKSSLPHLSGVLSDPGWASRTVYSTPLCSDDDAAERKRRSQELSISSTTHFGFGGKLDRKAAEELAASRLTENCLLCSRVCSRESTRL